MSSYTSFVNSELTTDWRQIPNDNRQTDRQTDRHTDRRGKEVLYVCMYISMYILGNKCSHERCNNSLLIPSYFLAGLHNDRWKFPLLYKYTTHRIWVDLIGDGQPLRIINDVLTVHSAPPNNERTTHHRRPIPWNTYIYTHDGLLHRCHMIYTQHTIPPKPFISHQPTRYGFWCRTVQ